MRKPTNLVVIGVVAILLVARTAILEAQDATVFVTHKLTKEGGSAVMTYRAAGADTSRRVAGLPKFLEVPDGSRACVVVDRANPVLYTYALSAKAIKVTVPDSMSSSLKLLMGLAQGAAPQKLVPMLGANPAGSPPGD